MAVQQKTPTPPKRRRRRTPQPPIKKSSGVAKLAKVILLTLFGMAELAYVILRVVLQVVILVTMAALLALKKGWRGGQRHFWRPVILSAFAWPTFDGAWLFWLTLSAVPGIWSAKRVLAHRQEVRAKADGQPAKPAPAARKRRRYLSTYELWLLGGAGLVLSAWHGALSVWPAVGLWGWAIYGVVYTLATLAFGWAWFDSRRIRSTAEGIDHFLHRWANLVAIIEGTTPFGPDGKPAPVDPDTGQPSKLSVPKLAGKWSHFEQRDDGVWVGIIDLSESKASEVAVLDEDVERALNLRRGAVTLGTDPKLTVRQLRVMVVLNPDALASRLNYWDGPSLDAEGRFVLARTKDQRPVYASLRSRKTGSAHFAGFAAPSGSGKGGATRIAVVEAALDPETLVIIIDGKRGAGVPYLRAGARLYVSDPKLWVPTIEAFVAAMEARKDSYAAEGRDSFTPRPGEPHVLLVIDELANGVLPQDRKTVVRCLKNIAGTGRSVGFSFWATMQKGDEPSWGATEIRSNVMDNGFMWLGPSTDVQTKNTSYQSLQSIYGVDPSQLPEEGGWCFVVGRVLQNRTGEAARGLWLPNRQDVSEKGHDAPFGVVEDVLEAGAVHPEWAEQVVFESVLATRSASAVLPAPQAAREEATVGPFAAPDVMSKLADATSTPAPSTSTTSGQRPAPTETQAAYLKTVVAAEGTPLSTREVARRLSVAPGTANDNLQALARKGWVEQTAGGWVEA